MDIYGRPASDANGLLLDRDYLDEILYPDVENTQKTNTQNEKQETSETFIFADIYPF